MTMLKKFKRLVPESVKEWYRTTKYRAGIRWRTMMHDDPSQAGEVSLIRKLVGPDWPKYLVDVGANDGQTISNSYVFVRDGWTGLLLEPNPDVCARLRKTHEGRANAICLEMAAGKETGTASMYVPTNDPMGFSGTLNTDENMVMAERREKTRTIEIKLETLTKLLEQHQFPGDFSFLSIDAEGCDLEVLQGLDFSRFRPRLIITEEYRIHAEREKVKLELMKDNGYVLYRPIGCNEIWGLPKYLPGK